MTLLPLVVASPLLKIPLLLNAARLAALAMTPPTPPPTPQEKEGYSGKTDPIRLLVRPASLLPALRRGIYWTVALLESAVILADYIAPPLSDTLLAYLVRDCMRTTHHIHITPTWLVGCALMHSGALLRLAAFRALGRLFTWQLSLQKAHVLVTRGPYAVVRHPGYTGLAMAAVGEVLCNFGPGSWYAECIGWDARASAWFVAAWVGWTVLVMGLLVRRVRTEEAVLESAFGEEWRAYVRETPYRLIPYIY